VGHPSAVAGIELKSFDGGFARSFSTHVRLGERGAPVPLSLVHLAAEGMQHWVQQYRPPLRFHLRAALSALSLRCFAQGGTVFYFYS
jgi:hypothetical protein